MMSWEPAMARRHRYTLNIDATILDTRREQLPGGGGVFELIPRGGLSVSLAFARRLTTFT